MLRNARGRFLQSHELFPLLGLKPGVHLPDIGFTKDVQGVTFICDPVMAPTIKPDGRKVKSSRARIRYICTCLAFVPYGRAGQHKCKDDASAHANRVADRIDGYDRDDLGESPDY
jgi:hypothetical protein